MKSLVLDRSAPHSLVTQSTAETGELSGCVVAAGLPNAMFWMDLGQNICEKQDINVFGAK